EVGGSGGIFDEHVLRGKGAVADLVHLVTAHRAGPGEDDGVANLFLLHHFFDTGEQVGIEFEAEDHDAFEVSGDRVDIGNGVAVGLGIALGRGGGVDDLAARLLGGGRGRKRQNRDPGVHRV